MTDYSGRNAVLEAAAKRLENIADAHDAGDDPDYAAAFRMAAREVSALKQEGVEAGQPEAAKQRSTSPSLDVVLERLISAARTVALVHTREVHDGGPFVIDIGAAGGAWRNHSAVPEEIWIKACVTIREITGLDPKSPSLPVGGG